VGEEFDYINGRVSRVSPAAVVLRYLRRYPINSKVKVTLIRESAIGVEYFDYDHVAEDVVHNKYALSGSARHMVERLRWISVDQEPRRDY
jgi:folate-binding Fe-S cluster repair protein YgfZ